jgi:hypothetical protein
VARTSAKSAGCGTLPVCILIKLRPAPR